jgi:hypothetical protein
VVKGVEGALAVPQVLDHAGLAIADHAVAVNVAEVSLGVPAHFSGLAPDCETYLRVLSQVVQFEAGQRAVEEDSALHVGIVQGHDVWLTGYRQAQIANLFLTQDLFHLFAGVYEFFG